ncbi:hypothetical protein LZ30DRAFT_732400 [Colletotrichum cereale]|nr:hypothetical protein LZ30DRAFT_732400 [Colletotrichum cereale]
MKLSYVFTVVLAAAQVQAMTMYCQCRINKHGRVKSYLANTRNTCTSKGGDMYNEAWCEVDIPRGRTWNSWWSDSCDHWGHCENQRPNV